MKNPCCGLCGGAINRGIMFILHAPRSYVKEAYPCSVCGILNSENGYAFVADYTKEGKGKNFLRMLLNGELMEIPLTEDQLQDVLGALEIEKECLM